MHAQFWKESYNLKRKAIEKSAKVIQLTESYLFCVYFFPCLALSDIVMINFLLHISDRIKIFFFLSKQNSNCPLELSFRKSVSLVNSVYELHYVIPMLLSLCLQNHYVTGSIIVCVFGEEKIEIMQKIDTPSRRLGAEMF